MSIVLRDAFRYQNFLEKCIQKTDMYLRRFDNIMLVTYEHKRSAVQPDAQDETLDNLQEREMEVSPDKVVDFFVSLYKEREAVSIAINTAKINHCPELDMDMYLNKTRQSIVERLNSMIATKCSTRLIKGTAYCFNNEGNQVEYCYDINAKSSYDFDKNRVKKIAREFASDSDTISTRIDYYLTSVPVNIIPKYDVNDTFEELIEKYAGSTAE